MCSNYDQNWLVDAIYLFCRSCVEFVVITDNLSLFLLNPIPGLYTAIGPPTLQVLSARKRGETSKKDGQREDRYLPGLPTLQSFPTLLLLKDV